jgi:hypothetical protein
MIGSASRPEVGATVAAIFRMRPCSGKGVAGRRRGTASALGLLSQMQAEAYGYRRSGSATGADTGRW